MYLQLFRVLSFSYLCHFVVSNRIANSARGGGGKGVIHFLRVLHLLFRVISQSCVVLLFLTSLPFPPIKCSECAVYPGQLPCITSLRKCNRRGGWGRMGVGSGGQGTSAHRWRGRGGRGAQVGRASTGRDEHSPEVQGSRRAERRTWLTDVELKGGGRGRGRG